ncbi:MAG: DUF3300 domain-containing protein [Opitutae bacterium]|nr:DUF3300 domain-containing protein [Opitutae bacterium]
MKTPLLLLACLAAFVGFGRLAAADVDDDTPPLTPDQIETLVAPIALYPDPLIALILPAATHASDVVLASRFLAGGGSPETVLSEPWDESVKVLTRYREVVDYLDRNLEWTRRLGDCFIDQPDDVMDAIQAVRARARAAGMLADTPQQEVVVESDEICILPTNPTVIYVPRYDPVVLCGPAVTSWYPRVWITFGVAYSVGPWLRYDCDWRARHVRIAQRPPAWYYQPDWRNHHHSTNVGWTRWSPPPRRDRDFDRRNDGPNRHWIGANDTIARRDRTPDRDHRGDRDRTRSPDFRRDRDRHARPDFDNRPRRESNSPAVATAPSVVAASPDALTAPVVASRPPGGFTTQTPPPFPERRRFPRPDDGPREDRTPHRDVRPGSPPPPMVNPAPMTSSPVGPPVRPPAPMVRTGSDASDRTPVPRDERRSGDRGGRGDRNRDRQQN